MPRNFCTDKPSVQNSRQDVVLHKLFHFHLLSYWLRYKGIVFLCCNGVETRDIFLHEMGLVLVSVVLFFCLSYASDDVINNCGGFVRPSKALSKYRTNFSFPNSTGQWLHHIQNWTCQE